MNHSAIKALFLSCLLGFFPHLEGQVLKEGSVSDPSFQAEPAGTATGNKGDVVHASSVDLDPFGNLSGRGLLKILDPFPLSVLHLQLPINTLEVLRQDEGKLNVNFSWANSFAVEKNLLVDAETYRLELSGWYALRNDFYVGAGIPVLAREGGVLDPLVRGFHRIFNLPEGGRSDRPNNAFEINVIDRGNKKRTLDRGIGLGDFFLKAHWNTHTGDRWFPAVSLDGVVSLPSSMKGFGSTGLDLGIAISFYKTVLDYFHLYAVLGVTYLTDPRTEGFAYEKVGNQGVGGIEISITRDIAFIFQAMSFSPLLEHPSPLDKVRNYVAGGLKWEFLRGFELEISLVENLFPFSNSADIAFTSGFSIKF